jgi:cytoskeletal protein RodZ
MAYSAIPKSAQQMIPAPPRTGASPRRPEPISHAASRRPATSSVTLQPAATAGLLQFLILLAVISGLTCLYVWQADTISAIRFETQTMTQQAQALERRNVSLMLEYARWDEPGYIEVESSESGMMVAQEPIRVQLPELSERQAELRPDVGDSTAISKVGAWLPGSLTIGSRPK